jgi:hypothetical protein
MIARVSARIAVAAAAARAFPSRGIPRNHQLG